MNTSPQGLIEIMSHEGVCLEPYLDSVGVWTIGVGITKYDGKDPRDMGKITIDQAIELFKDRIKAYEAPIQKSGVTFTQTQFDALASFCFNCGQGNLTKLIHGRSVSQIGDALMLYTKPPEITRRRQDEQRLYKSGKYSSGGKVLVFPVGPSHHPVYGKGYQLDVSKYFEGKPVPAPLPPPATPPVTTTVAAKQTQTPPEDLPLRDVWEWLRNH